MYKYEEIILERVNIQLHSVTPNILLRFAHLFKFHGLQVACEHLTTRWQ